MTGKTTENVTFVGGQPKVAPSKIRGCLNFLYDRETGKVLGRTGKSWFQITLFYIIFYGVLAAFFAVLLVLFLQTLDPGQPKWQGTNGIIGDKPGMGYRPTTGEKDDVGSTLIWLKHDATTTDKYINQMDKFLKDYRVSNEATVTADGPLIDCTKRRPAANSKEVCKYVINDLGDCANIDGYGYRQGQPCVLIKLNKIYGWTPDTYNATDIASPTFPKELIAAHNGTAPPPDQLYFTCNGEDDVDKENIGPMKMYPPSVSTNHYPYLHNPGYLAPVVMVQFLNPAPGVLINVECRAWAKNIPYSKTDRLGMVHFELLVDR